MKGYKGFDKDLKCQELPSTGKSKQDLATHGGTVKLCPTADEAKRGIGGFHFCEHPLDTWNYYKPLNGSRYADVEGDGVSDTRDGWR